MSDDKVRAAVKVLVNVMVGTASGEEIADAYIAFGDALVEAHPAKVEPVASA